MRFYDLAKYFERIEKTTLRNEMMEILAELFTKSSDEDIAQIVYLSLGRLRPKFDRLEFNLADKMVVKAIARMAGVTNQEMMAKYKEVGDVGEVIEEARSEKQEVRSENKKQELSVAEVFERLERIAYEEGQGSQERKIIGLANLLSELDPLSGRYVGRMVLAKLRLGFSDKTILDALSFMEHGDKSGRKKLDEAYQMSPDVGNIAILTKKFKIDGVMDRIEVCFGVPVIPALAQRLKTSQEMIDKMGKVMLEAKFDGTRVQIHFSRSEKQEVRSKNQEHGVSDGSMESGLFGEEKKDSEVRTFTRNLDENSFMFPELQNIADQINAEEVILDAEAIGYDRETGDLLPFQMTITRKRKHGISEAQKRVPLKFFVFDVLYRDGESLLQMPLMQRRELLEKTILPGEVLVVDDFMVTDDPKVVREYHQEQLDKDLEGAMVKKIDGVYSPGRTGHNWVKFKETEDSTGKLSDTIDPVVMGYYKGKGKRAAFGIGAFLVGVRGKIKTPIRQTQGKQNSDIKDDESDQEEILTLAKIGTGLLDDEWREMKRRADECEVSEKPKEYGKVDTTLTPDVWVDPKIIVEVAADEITKSPSHSAGVALRFPRLVKFRDDKNVEQITSVEELSGISHLL